MKMKEMKLIIMLSLFFFGMYYLINRICHPRKNMVNVKRNTTYRELVWNYGMPDVIGGVFGESGKIYSDDKKIVVFKINDNLSYQLWFYRVDNRYVLRNLNVVEDGIIHCIDLEEKHTK